MAADDALSGLRQQTRRGGPAADRRFDRDAREQLEFVGVDPAALGDDTLDRTIGPRSRRPDNRRDVEDLAAADGLVAARLAQHVAVAGQERQRIGKEQPDRAGGAGCQGLGAEHTHLDGQLARSDVGQVGPTSRHVVVERGEHVE